MFYTRQFNASLIRSADIFYSGTIDWRHNIRLSVHERDRRDRSFTVSSDIGEPPGNATWLYAVKIKIAVDYSDTFRSYRDRYFHFVGGLTETDWNRNDLSEIFLMKDTKRLRYWNLNWVSRKICLRSDWTRMRTQSLRLIDNNRAGDFYRVADGMFEVPAISW